MKVFIRTSDLGEESPRVIATYADGSSVADNAHGDGLSVLTLPADALAKTGVGAPGQGTFTRVRAKGLPRLASDWRQRTGKFAVEAEAKRRIEEVASEQISDLLKLINDMMAYGTDISKWPADASQRKTEFDAKRNYIDAVKEKLRAYSAAVPFDPSSDKIWPQRLVKK